MEELTMKERLALVAALQKKKNALRAELAERGILSRGGKNAYDGYSYFSEAQYKKLFTELFSKHGLELKFTELEYLTYEGSGRQNNGRIPKLMFTLFDTDTGFSEDTVISGEGMDKGDKAGYKAYTGALKYFLANTFMVATGDDPEKDSPNEKAESKATPNQVSILEKAYTGDNLTKLLEVHKVQALSDLPAGTASNLVKKLQERGKA